MLRKEACSGSISDLSHIRTQWCLAVCLTNKSANPQNLIDVVRSGILKEVDSHPPYRSLLEHKAYLRSWLPTVYSHVAFRHDVFLLGDFLKDSSPFFEFMPVAQDKETRGTFCYFAMAGSNRWNKSGSQARGSTDPNPNYDRDDEEPINYAVHRSREVPNYRPQSVYLHENHIEYCYGFRHPCSWKDSEQHTTLEREVCVESMDIQKCIVVTNYRLLWTQCLGWKKDHSSTSTMTS